MQIAVFGASGRTGQAVVDGALRRGWGVQALVRPAAVLEPRPGLVVTRGDLESERDLEQRLRQAEERGRPQRLVADRVITGISRRVIASLASPRTDGAVAHARTRGDRAKSQRLESLTRSDVVRRPHDGLTAHILSNFLSRHWVVSLAGRTCW